MRYYGGKQKLVSFIDDTVENVLNGQRGHIGDAFAGTGVVASGLRRAGHSVSANDVLYLSACLNVENLNFSPDASASVTSQQRIGEELEAHFRSVKPVDGIVTEAFSPAGAMHRQYFSVENARLIDGIREEISVLSKQGALSEYWEEFLVARLLRAINQVSNITGTYAAFMKSWDSRAKKSLNFSLEGKSLVLPELRSQVQNSDVDEYLAENAFDVVYLDPPYNTRDYSTNYGILEYIALGFPATNKPEGLTGAVKFPDKKSDFTSKRKVGEAFSRLFSNLNARHALLSYNNEGLMSRDEIMEMLRLFGKVVVREQEHKRFRSINQDGSNIRTVESLYIVSF